MREVTVGGAGYDFTVDGSELFDSVAECYNLSGTYKGTETRNQHYFIKTYL